MAKLGAKHKLAIRLLNLLSKTWRIKLHGELPTGPGIVAFWHGEMLPIWKIFSPKRPYAVVSQSKDGQILSELLERWGFNMLRGSSSKGGKEVLADMTETIKTNILLMTPDGPRGPRGQFKAGAVVAAQRSGSPLYLAAMKSKNVHRFLKSWDHFQLPKPFARIKVIISEPIIVEQDSNREEISRIILESENKLNELRRRMH